MFRSEPCRLLGCSSDVLLSSYQLVKYTFYYCTCKRVLNARRVSGYDFTVLSQITSLASSTTLETFPPLRCCAHNSRYETLNPSLSTGQCHMHTTVKVATKSFRFIPQATYSVSITVLLDRIMLIVELIYVVCATSRGEYDIALPCRQRLGA